MGSLVLQWFQGRQSVWGDVFDEKEVLNIVCIFHAALVQAWF